jgi:hypothetical protein
MILYKFVDLQDVSKKKCKSTNFFSLQSTKDLRLSFFDFSRPLLPPTVGRAYARSIRAINNGLKGRNILA